MIDHPFEVGQRVRYRDDYQRTGVVILLKFRTIRVALDPRPDNYGPWIESTPDLWEKEPPKT